MFGGGLNQVWPFAAIALHYFNGFPERYSRAVSASEQVIAGLKSDNRCEVRRVPNGTNIFYLRANQVSQESYQQRAREAGFTLSAAQDGQFMVRVNETWNRATPPAILDRLRTALG